MKTIIEIPTDRWRKDIHLEIVDSLSSIYEYRDINENLSGIYLIVPQIGRVDIIVMDYYCYCENRIVKMRECLSSYGCKLKFIDEIISPMFINSLGCKRVKVNGKSYSRDGSIPRKQYKDLFISIDTLRLMKYLYDTGLLRKERKDISQCKMVFGKPKFTTYENKKKK